MHSGSFAVSSSSSPSDDSELERVKAEDVEGIERLTEALDGSIQREGEKDGEGAGREGGRKGKTRAKKKRRPVGFTKDGRLRVGSHSVPGKWYELRISGEGQLLCGPEGNECESWRQRGQCGHVELGAEFLETHPYFSQQQQNFWEASYKDRFRQAIRALAKRSGPLLYIVK